MNKYFILSLILLSSCVGKIIQTDVLIKGAYKLELNSIYKEDSPNLKWTKHNTHIGQDIFEINIGSISYDLIIDLKLSKVNRSSNLILSPNSFKIINNKKSGPAFEIVSYDCNKPVEEYCNIKIASRWKDGENVELGVNDYIDFELKEEVFTSIEEAVSFNVSLDVYRKKKSIILFNQALLAEYNFNNVDYFTSVESIILTSFEVDGELDYEIISTIKDDQGANAFSILETSEDRSHNFKVSFLEMQGSGINFNSNPAKLEVAIKFENESEVKSINKRTVNLKGSRNTKPIINFSPSGSITSSTNFSIKNVGGNNSVINNISFNFEEPYNINACINGLTLIANSCNSGYILEKNIPSSTCAFTINVNLATIGANACIGKLIYTGDNNKTVKNYEISVNAVPSKLEIFENENCTGNIISSSSLIFQDLVVNNSSTKNISIKNVGITPSENVLTASDLDFKITGSNYFTYSLEDISNPCSNSLAGNSCCNIALNFNPSDSGNFNANFNANYTDSSMEANTNDANISLSGSSKTKADLVFNTNILDFDKLLKGSSLVNICTASNCIIDNYVGIKKQTISVNNNGEWTATSINVDFQGTYKDLLSIENNNCSTLTSDATCSFTLVLNANNYDSTIDGTLLSNTIVKITYNDGVIDNSLLESSSIEASILLAGTALISTPVSFGIKVPNDGAGKYITLSNNNPSKNYIADILINTYDFTNNNEHWYVDYENSNCVNSDGSPKLLANNESCTYLVFFKPLDNSYAFPVESKSFPYSGLTENDVTLALNSIFNINYSDYISNNIVSTNLEGKVGKKAELVITGVSSAIRRSVDSNNENYNWFNNTITNFTASDEGNIVYKLGVGNKNGATKAYWNFDKVFIGQALESAALKIKFKNIGYETARMVRPLITGTDSTNFGIFANNTDTQTCSTRQEYWDNISGLAELERAISFCYDSGNNYGEKQAFISSFIYRSGSQNLNRYLSYKKTSPNDAYGIDLKAFLVKKPSLNVSYKNINDTTYTDVTANNNIDFGTFVYNLGDDNTSKLFNIKLTVDESNTIDEFYKQNIIVDEANINLLPFSLLGFSFNETSILSIVKELFNSEINDNEQIIPGKNVSQINNLTSLENYYTLSLSYDDLAEGSLTRHFCGDKTYSIESNPASGSTSNYAYRIAFNNYNAYGNKDNFNFGNNSYSFKKINFKYKILPPLSANNACSFSLTKNESAKIIDLSNNSNFDIYNLSSSSYNSCSGMSAYNDSLVILFNNETYDGYTCSIENNPCQKDSSVSALLVGATCKVCLKYKHHVHFSSTPYEKLYQDIDLSYIVNDETTTSHFEVFKEYGSGNFTRLNFPDGSAYKVSSNNVDYYDYTSGGICSNSPSSLILKDLDAFYIKARLKNTGEIPIIFRTFQGFTYQFIPNLGNPYYNSSNKPSFVHNNSPFKVSINSFMCGASNILTGDSVSINNTAECYFVAKLEKYDKSFTELCSYYSDLNLTVMYHPTQGYNYQFRLRHNGVCGENISSTSFPTFFLIGSSQSVGF